MQATARIYHNTWKDRKIKSGLYPVKLVVTQKRQRKYYSIIQFLKNEEWSHLSEDDYNHVYSLGKYAEINPTGKYKDMRFEYDRIKHKAQDVISGMDTFSFAEFEKRFFNKAGNWQNVKKAFEGHIENLKAEDRYGYAISFNSTLQAIKGYTKHNLAFSDITPDWLKKFERHLKKEGKSEVTIGIYGRNIRTIFNIALKNGVKAKYPFNEYKPKKGKGRKTALPPQQMNQIINYPALEGTATERYRDLFAFSLFANGMNLSDILRLKHKNITDGQIRFEREKTKRSEATTIEVEISDTLQRIINKYATRSINDEVYLFPYLNNEMTEQEKYDKIRDVNRRVNRSLDKMAKELKIKEKVSTYTARHSYATILKNSGVSTEYLKEALGHSSVNVTENYLASFERDTKRKIANEFEKIVNYNAG